MIFQKIRKNNSGRGHSVSKILEGLREKRVKCFLHRAKTRLSILYRNLDLCFYIICELVYKMCFSLSQLFLYQKCMGDIMNLLLRIHLLKSTY